MPNLDKNRKNSFSWINIIIILMAAIIGSYLAYTYYNPQTDQQNIKTDYFEDLIENTPEIIAQETPDTESINIAEESKPITFFSDREKNNNAIVSEVVIDETTETATPLLLVESTEEIEDNYTDLLKASDQRIYSSLAEFSQQTDDVRKLLHDNMLINTIVFIENFSHGYFISKFSPMIAPTKEFTTQYNGGNLIIDPRSYQRYDDYANYIYSVDSKEFVQYYLNLKPSIDDFYAEIAKPNVTFEDTLSKAISIVLSTPVIYKEIKVNSPSVMYLYDDPELESLNDAQKLLLRMGPQNLAKIKHKLRSIQAELTITNK